MHLNRTLVRCWSLVLLTAFGACGGSDLPVTRESETAAPQDITPNGSATTASEATPIVVEPTSKGCADVVGVAVRGGDGVFSFDVTVSSDDSRWEKYADAWEVRDIDGIVLGVRLLAHPHDTEQPFTRSLSGVEVPENVTEVAVAARDSVLGFCGLTMTVAVPHGS